MAMVQSLKQRVGIELFFFYEGKGRDSNELANLEMGSRHYEAW